MKHYPHTNMMTLKEWKQFVKNYESYNFMSYSKLPLKDYLLKHENLSFDFLIGNAFRWKVTPQKHKYWEKISLRTKPVQ